MGSLEVETRFRQWKEELEGRLEAHLQEHKEKEVDPARLLPSGDDSIKVVQSVLNPDGGWVVYREGRVVYSFNGTDAHERALKFAQQLRDIKKRSV